MAKVNSFRDLLVWQKAMALVQNTYRITANLPKEETYGLKAQLRRCGASIPSNIAEGYGRHSTIDYLRFLRIAVGSLFEMQTQIEIAYRLDYLDKTVFREIDDSCCELERMLASMINKLTAKQQASQQR